MWLQCTDRDEHRVAGQQKPRGEPQEERKSEKKGGSTHGCKTEGEAKGVTASGNSIQH